VSGNDPWVMLSLARHGRPLGKRRGMSVPPKPLAASSEDQLPGLVDLNAAVLDMLAVWQREVGTDRTAEEFGLSEHGVEAASIWAMSSRERRRVAAEPFAFVTIDTALCPSGPGRQGAFADHGDILSRSAPDSQRFRQVMVVQAMVIACMMSLSAIDAGLPSVLFATNAAEEMACREAVRAGPAWLRVPGRWIVAARHLDARLCAKAWGYRERYASMSAMLQQATWS